MQKDVNRTSAESEQEEEGEEGEKGQHRHELCPSYLVGRVLKKIFATADLFTSVSLSSLFSLAFPHGSKAVGWEEVEEEEGGR